MAALAEAVLKSLSVVVLGDHYHVLELLAL
jgi:hypothetical protein